jgi:hypothetical protein
VIASSAIDAAATNINTDSPSRDDESTSFYGFEFCMTSLPSTSRVAELVGDLGITRWRYYIHILLKLRNCKSVKYFPNG